jgi:hypothetical protein
MERALSVITCPVCTSALTSPQTIGIGRGVQTITVLT